MKEPSESTVCVCDSDRSLFMPLAMHLAKDGGFKRVLYSVGTDASFPKFGDACIGKGFGTFDRVDDFMLTEHKSEIDLFVFPDIGNVGLQLELESQGKLVWGSRRGDAYETRREMFHKTLGEIGLQTPDNHVCSGLDELWSFLEDKENVYIKISRYRGSWETKKFRNMKLDEGLLYLLGTRFFPAHNKVKFIVCFEIPTTLEIGGDSYSIDGEWPSLMLHGLEKKDRAYFAAVTKREAMPEQLQEIFSAFGPKLKECRYRNQISFEDRVAGNKHYWIDATQRGGLPSSASQYTAWSNLPEILMAGADGILIEPIPSAKFTAECILTLKSDKEIAGTTEIPDELREWMNIASAYEVDGVVAFPPDGDHSGNEIGWLCSTGNTIESTVEKMKELADALPDGLDADTDALVDLLKEIHDEEKAGIEFARQEIPKPASALNI